MRRALLLIPFLALPGCLTTSAPRQYHYDIELQNTSGRTIAMELLQTQHANINKIRADIGPGGVYSSRYTTHDSADYLEARFRFPDAPPDSPWFIHELPRGQTRATISVSDHQINLTPRRPPLIQDVP